MKILLIGLLLHVQLMSNDMTALQIESCLKSSRCDKGNYNPTDWHKDILPLPSEIMCDNKMRLYDFANEWLKKARPDSYLSDIECVDIKGQMG